MAYQISGTTSVSGTLEQCIVRIYLRSDGILIEEKLSDVINGTYTFTGLTGVADYDVVCISNTANICPQISGPINATLV